LRVAGPRGGNRRSRSLKEQLIAGYWPARPCQYITSQLRRHVRRADCSFDWLFIQRGRPPSARASGSAARWDPSWGSSRT
jgi:hypothetical protein